MEAHEFVFKHAKKAVLAKGFSEFQAQDAAQHALMMYKRNQLTKMTEFTNEAVNYAQRQYGKPRQ